MNLEEASRWAAHYRNSEAERQWIAETQWRAVPRTAPAGQAASGQTGSGQVGTAPPNYECW